MPKLNLTVSELIQPHAIFFFVSTSSGTNVYGLNCFNSWEQKLTLTVLSKFHPSYLTIYVSHVEVVLASRNLRPYSTFSPSQMLIIEGLLNLSLKEEELEKVLAHISWLSQILTGE